MNVWVKTILNQLLGTTGGSTARSQLSFTGKCIKQMGDWGLSESDVEDVFRHGEVVAENMMSRKYGGYEIGMYYFRDKRNGNYIVTAVWKRERR